MEGEGGEVRGAGEESRTVALHLSCFACASVSLSHAAASRAVSS